MAKKEKKEKKEKKKLAWKGQLLMVALTVCGVFFTPTTIILLAGMLPTIIAAYADRTKEKMRAITVGALNLAGCTPFILKLWMSDHTIDQALNILTDPLAWVIMYASAALGYCIEWAVVGAVSVFVIERANIQIKFLARQQEEIKERWGSEVTGEMPLDEYGFLIPEQSPAKKSNNNEESV